MAVGFDSESGHGWKSVLRNVSAYVLGIRRRRTIVIVISCLYRVPWRSLWNVISDLEVCGRGREKAFGLETAKAYESAHRQRSSVGSGSRCHAGICPGRNGSIV